MHACFPRVCERAFLCVLMRSCAGIVLPGWACARAPACASRACVCTLLCVCTLMCVCMCVRGATWVSLSIVSVSVWAPWPLCGVLGRGEREVASKALILSHRSKRSPAGCTLSCVLRLVPTPEDAVGRRVPPPLTTNVGPGEKLYPFQMPSPPAQPCRPGPSRTEDDKQSCPGPAELSGVFVGRLPGQAGAEWLEMGGRDGWFSTAGVRIETTAPSHRP